MQTQRCICRLHNLFSHALEDELSLINSARVMHQCARIPIYLYKVICIKGGACVSMSEAVCIKYVYNAFIKKS